MRTLALTSTLLTVLASQAVAAGPPITLRLSEENYTTGDHARIHVKTADNGSLVVLQLDPGGHVRVLYPLSPDDPASIQGGRDVEIRGRGDRDAFTVTQREGTGMVLAAVSSQPFNFSALARGHRWDSRSLEASDSIARLSPEEVLLEVVDRMTDRPYEYDAAPYTISGQRYERVYPAWGAGPWYPGSYDDPWFYPGFGFSVRIGHVFGHRR